MFEFNMDAHMHFDLYDNREQVLQYVKNHKSYTIAVTNLPQLFKRYRNICEGNEYVQLALGFHPELVYEYKSQERLFSELVHETRYIGEVGLDFAKKSKEDIDAQIEMFTKIISWCTGKRKILSVHSRSAVKKVLDLLEDFDGVVILHWYSGGIAELDRAISRGYYFSVNHQMVQSANGRKIIERIPVEKILLESDAPFTKGLKDRYSIAFNEELYSYLSQHYHQDTEVVKKRIKANFAALLKKSK